MHSQEILQTDRQTRLPLVRQRGNYSDEDSAASLTLGRSAGRLFFLLVLASMNGEAI